VNTSLPLAHTARRSIRVHHQWGGVVLAPSNWGWARGEKS